MKSLPPITSGGARMIVRPQRAATQGGDRTGRRVSNWQGLANREPSALRSGFTLVETMVTMGIFLFVLSGIITSYMYGLRMFEIAKPKLTASDDAREAISKLVDEVRAAKLVRIGTGTLNSFTEVGVNSLQVGSAIQLYPTTDTNTFIRYYWDSAEQRLKRVQSGAVTYSVMANAVTNSQVFTSEDFQGNIHTNNMNNRVIGLSLQFNQIQYPVMAVGPGNYYDYYQLRTKITRRVLF